MSCAVWLGAAAPLRSIRWVDGALDTAAKLGHATAVAAGSTGWLDLAADRAKRAGVASVGVQTDLRLDYLGWAHDAEDGPEGWRWDGNRKMHLQRELSLSMAMR